jgi:hypothetical protein
MSKVVPGEMRDRAKKLLGRIADTNEKSEKRKLASQAFALAQEAEATERSGENSQTGTGK